MHRDASIDERELDVGGQRRPLGELVREWMSSATPGIDAIRRAAPLFVNASPAMVQSCASWLEVDERLANLGVSDAERLHVYARASTRAYETHAPSEPILVRACARVSREVLVELLDAIAEEEEVEPYQLGSLAEVAVATLGRTGEIPERFDRFLTFHRSWPVTKDLVGALPEARRHAKLQELLDAPDMGNVQNLWWRAHKALCLRSLLAESHLEKLRAIVEVVRASGKPQHQQLVARFDEGSSIPQTDVRGDDGLTDDVRRAVEYCVKKAAKARLEAALGPLAEERATLCVEVDAPELADLGTWRETDANRQQQIAEAVAAGCADRGLRFLGLEETAPAGATLTQTKPSDSPLRIAVFEHAGTKQRLSLIPGGSYVRGFSEGEEGVVREAAAVAKKELAAEAEEGDPNPGNYYEEYEYLFDQAKTMRPAVEVRVGPFLAFQAASEPFSPDEATAVFEELPFRLLSETEWEYFSRGGKQSELSWRGDALPQEAWFEETQEGGASLANAFGGWGFGLFPEACSDVWTASYEGAPTDGTPRTGEGPRVVRGGAAMIYPWQACGEWQLLCNAVRSSQKAWEYFLSLRPALGVTLK